jgi:RNA polymerase sigma-70 factor, ECF subfamily
MNSFGEIYTHFQPRIYRYLCNLSGEADALDLTQTVFLKVSRSLDDFRGDSSFATWIYRIATNTSHDHAVSPLSKQRGAELLFDEVSSLDDLHDPDSQGTDRQYIRQEMNECIRGLVDQLPENYRTVLLLSEYEEFSNAEIAEMLHISLGTVKIRLHRGRTHLRKSMECRCTFYHGDRNELLCDRK